MEPSILLNSKVIRKYNHAKYRGIAPSIDLMNEVIKKSKLRFLNRFENVWGIPSGMLTLIMNGKRGLPVKYWHIFYDFDAVNQMYANPIKKQKILPKKPTILETNKKVIDGLRIR